MPSVLGCAVSASPVDLWTTTNPLGTTMSKKDAAKSVTKEHARMWIRQTNPFQPAVWFVATYQTWWNTTVACNLKSSSLHGCKNHYYRIAPWLISLWSRTNTEQIAHVTMPCGWLLVADLTTASNPPPLLDRFRSH